MLNGRIPDGQLVTLGVDAEGRPVRLMAAAAASLSRVSEASGIAIGRASISDSYRDYDRQKRYEDNPPNGKGLAAVAGTSQHGWGLAIDARGLLLLWLAQHGPEYGWVRTIKAESWHFEYVAARDEHIPAPQPEPAAAPTPAPTAPVASWEDIDMTSFITEALTDAYWQEVGRAPDEPGLRFRRLRIATGATTLAQEIQDIDAGTESNRFAANGVYREVFGRDGDVPGLDYWIDRVGGGDIDQKLDQLRALLVAAKADGAK